MWGVLAEAWDLPPAPVDRDMGAVQTRIILIGAVDVVDLIINDGPWTTPETIQIVSLRQFTTSNGHCQSLILLLPVVDLVRAYIVRIRSTKRRC